MLILFSSFLLGFLLTGFLVRIIALVYLVYYKSLFTDHYPLDRLPTTAQMSERLIHGAFVSLFLALIPAWVLSKPSLLHGTAFFSGFMLVCLGWSLGTLFYRATP